MGSAIRSVFGWIMQAVVFTFVADIVASYLRHKREQAAQEEMARQG
jgi:hypothetical protein